MDIVGTAVAAYGAPVVVLLWSTIWPRTNVQTAPVWGEPWLMHQRAGRAPAS